MSAPRILAGYRHLFCALLVIASFQALLTPGQEHAHLKLLAVAEAIGAVLLVWRRTQWLGAWTLLLVFSCAQIAAARAAEWPVRFVLYAACAFLIALLDGALRSERRSSIGTGRIPGGRICARGNSSGFEQFRRDDDSALSVQK